MSLGWVLSTWGGTSLFPASFSLRDDRWMKLGGWTHVWVTKVLMGGAGAETSPYYSSFFAFFFLSVSLASQQSNSLGLSLKPHWEMYAVGPHVYNTQGGELPHGKWSHTSLPSPP